MGYHGEFNGHTGVRKASPDMLIGLTYVISADVSAYMLIGLTYGISADMQGSATW